MKKKINIRIPKYFDFKNFEDEFLKHEFYKKFDENKKDRKYVFDLKAVGWIDLMELMGLPIASDFIFKKTGCESQFIFYKDENGGQKNRPKTLVDVVNFVQSMDFPKLLIEKGIEINLDPSPAIDSSRFLAIRNLDFQTFVDLQEKIGEILEYWYADWLSNVQIYSFVKRLVFETCENVFEHAYDQKRDPQHTSKLIAIRRYAHTKTRETELLRAELGVSWIRDLQRMYPKKDILEVVVADGGLGIQGTLGETYKKRVIEWTQREQGRDPIPYELSEGACIKWALSKSRSTSSTMELAKRKKGFGLFLIKMYTVKGWGGCLILRSGKSRVVYLGDENKPVLENNGNLESFPGVQIRLFLPITDRHAEIQAVKEMDDNLGVKEDEETFEFS